MRPASAPRRWPAIAGTGLVLALMALLREQLNPDWLGYAAIYQDAGAWLADQGRDPLFLLLVGSASTLLGADGYLLFRALVAVYFAFFTLLLLRGRIVPFGATAPGGLLLLLGLLPFAVPRFTIQIREGLALTVVLFGIALLRDRAAARAAPAARAGHTGDGSTTAAVALFVAAAALHSGALILLAALLAGLFIGRLCNRSLRLELLLLLAMAVAAVGTALAVAVFVPATRAGAALVDNVYGIVAADDATMSFAKGLYWALYGAGVLAVAARVHALYGAGRLPVRLRPVLGLVALVLLPAIYAAAVVLLGSGMPAIVVSAAARVMNMLLSVTLLVLALQGALGAGLALFALLVLADQARIIVEAVLGALGGGGLL